MCVVYSEVLLVNRGTCTCFPFADGTVDAVTFATGTGGTLAGVSMFLKSKNPNIKAILADPDVSIEC